jgi:hypothetical protein
MTHTYIYRGVKFTKDGNELVTQKCNRLRNKLDKVYRGIHYLKLPNVKQIASDHVYRGAHYMA